MRPSDDKMIKLWPVFIVAVVAIFVFLSFQRVMRLDAHPPTDFVQAGGGRAHNAVLADEYWNTAVNVIQWRYARGTALPEDPPSDFAVSSGLAGKADSAVARLAYWNALRRLWLKPESWHTTLEFDLTWTGRAVQTVVYYARALFK